MKKLFLVLAICLSVLGFYGQSSCAAEDVKLSDDASGFVLLTDVVPDAILEIAIIPHTISWATVLTAISSLPRC